MTASEWLACPDARQLIQAELDRPLLTDEALSLRVHLSHCDHCRGYRDDLARVQALLTQTGHGIAHPAHSLPDLTARVSRQVQQQQPRKRLFALVRAAAQVGGAAMVVMLALRIERPVPIKGAVVKAAPVVTAALPSALPASAQMQIPALEFAGDERPADHPGVVVWPTRSLPGMIIPD